MQRLSLIIAFSLGPFIQLSAQAADFEDLDKIVLKAGGVAAFLESKSAQNRYLEVLRVIANRTVDEQAYFQLITQVKSVVKAAPKSNIKLLESVPKFEEIEFRSRAAFEGYDLDDIAWESAAEAINRELESKANGVTSKQALDIVKQANTEYFDLLVRLEREKIPGRESEKRSALAAGEIKSRPGIQSASARLLLDAYRTNGFFSFRNADEILAALGQLARDPADYIYSFQDLSLRVGRLTPSLIKMNVLPARQFVKKYSTAFKKSQRFTAQGKRVDEAHVNAARYTLSSLPRKFHEIFKAYWGMGNECIGGSMCMFTLPNRWGSSLVDGSRLYAFKKNGTVRGYTQVSAMVGSVSQQRYYNLDLHSRDFDDYVYVNDEDVRNNKRVRLFEALYPSFYEKLPDHRGIILNQRSPINHELSAITTRPMVLGRPLSEGVAIQDRTSMIAKSLAANFDYNKYWHGGGLAVDATIGNEGSQLYILADPEYIEKSTAPDEYIKFKAEWLAWASNPKKQRRLLLEAIKIPDVKAFIKSRLEFEPTEIQKMFHHNCTAIWNR